MNYRTLFTSEHLDIFDLSPYIPCAILVSWKGHWGVEEYHKELLQQTLDHFRDHHTQIMVSDHSTLQMVTLDLQELLEDWYYKEASKHGLKVEIWIEPTDILARASVSLMLGGDLSRNTEMLMPKVPDLDEALLLASQFAEQL
ncbi:hypothetical protein [Microscilla marina]|uniref:Uncharacterized protein n=1 Tax=Microscilla marina ATCC 23134 TaxID=313606 RepID=A1ZYY0_MICM2|nr:hypothetical protein [Microscilla marina]EAY24416.1 hypothetical protein M23134_01756 [Microscilla marina ATCC 23134]